MSSGVHSILAPSDAERWARCPGALHLSKGVKDEDAEYSASGTCSHWILEKSLKNELNPDVFIGETLEFNGFKFKVDQERVDRVRSVMTNIYREPGQMWVEEELNTSPILGVPSQIGHADVCKVDPLGEVRIDGESYIGVLSVHDFKDGYIRVMAENNMQGLIYLAAKLFSVDLLCEVNALRFCIHQPKIGHYDEWTYTRKYIEDFTTAIQPVAKLAYDLYYGNVAFDASTHLIPGDVQCQWCPVRGRCPARAKSIVELFQLVINSHEIDDTKLSELYLRLDEIEQACKDYREEAYRRAMMGHTIQGQKLVRGKRGNRHYTDKVKAEAALSLILPEEQMYEPRTLVSPTVAERLLKDDYKYVAPFVEQNPGAISLAPVDDPRPEIVIPKFQPRPTQESQP